MVEDKGQFSLFSRVNQTATKETSIGEAKPEPSPPQAPQQTPRPQPASNTDNENTIRRLEQELFKEKEKSLRAEILLKERENVRLEMEQMFQAMKDQLKEERLSQSIETELASARGRVETLEKRLDEMNQLFLKTLSVKEDFAQGLDTIRQQIGQLKCSLEDNISVVGKQFEKITNELASESVKYAGLEERLREATAKTCSDLKDLDTKLTTISSSVEGLEEKSKTAMDNIKCLETAKNTSDEKLKEAAKTCADGITGLKDKFAADIDAKLEMISNRVYSAEEKSKLVMDNIKCLETGLTDEHKSMELLNQNWLRDKTEMCEDFFNKIEELKEKLEADNSSQNTTIKEVLSKITDKIAGLERQISEIKALSPKGLTDEIKNMYACIENVFQTIKTELREYVYAMDSQGAVSQKILDRKNELITLMTKINVEIGRLRNEFLKAGTNTPPVNPS